MLTPRLRERLSRLARGVAERAPETARAALAPETAPPGPPTEPVAAEPWLLAYDLPGDALALEGETGQCLLVQPDLGVLLADHRARVERWLGLATGTWGLPDRRLLIDIETTGLSGAPLFLIGTLCLEDGVLRLRQFLARDYSEEAAILAHFFGRAGLYEHVVTFNGQTFDLPYLLDRALYHRIAGGFPQAHVDLLGPARRRWRGQFPDCRLGTLETYVCGRRRVADVSGAAIPQLYHEFVRAGSWDLLAPVLFHNALDLLTMAELAAHL